MGLLDALPVERWRVWIAKTAFAAASTTALGALLMLCATAMGGVAEDVDLQAVAFLFLCGFGWSLFWSASLGNALLAAVLGMGSLVLTWLQLMGTEGFVVGQGGVSHLLTTWHWIIAMALVPASALILMLGGPPRRFGIGSRRRSSFAPVEPRERRVGAYLYLATGPSLTRRLAWRAWRETWPVWWPLALLGFGVPLAASPWYSPFHPWVFFPCASVVGWVLGVNVFNAENREGTRRFLVHHGARPGLVWLVNVGVGLAAASAIWFAMIIFSFLLESEWSMGRPVAAPFDLWAVAATIRSVIAISESFAGSAFASGVLCGMIFRRGITAGIMSLVFWLIIGWPTYLLASWELMNPNHMFWVPVGILAVSWAWSGDWLLDRPGFGRWVRLGIYLTAAAVVLSSAYIAERAWSVPAIGLAQRASIFQVDRIAAQVPSDENAAGLYREVAARQIGRPPIQYLRQGPWAVSPLADWDAKASEIRDWVNYNEESLETLRQAAAMPASQFQDPRKMTSLSSERDDWGGVHFDLALTGSSQVRFARGDLEGSWRDIEALLRMGRQFSAPNPTTALQFGAQAESIGLFLASRWANDRRLTVEMLEEARDSYRNLPPSPSLADRIRAAALLIRNTSELPREDLVFGLLLPREVGRGNFSPMLKLELDAKTTPWEMARFRRVLDLVTAARIQLAERQPNRADSPSLKELVDGAAIGGEGPRAFGLSALELLQLDQTTPMAREECGRPPLRGWVPSDENMVNRRAVDIILSLRLQQARNGGRLPESLDELVKADPGVEPSLTDPHRPSGRFGYVRSQGQMLPTLEPVDGDSLAKEGPPAPTHGHMILFSFGPDGGSDQAIFGYGRLGGDDIVFPIRDGVTPPE